MILSKSPPDPYVPIWGGLGENLTIASSTTALWSESVTAICRTLVGQLLQKKTQQRSLNFNVLNVQISELSRAQGRNRKNNVPS
jgi:hypothetical protein